MQNIDSSLNILYVLGGESGTKFKIVARSGCSELIPSLIIEEEVVAEVEAENEEELAEIVRGKIIQIKGENCILIPEGEPPQLLMNEKFLRWWAKANLQEMEGTKGKLFILRT